MFKVKNIIYILFDKIFALLPFQILNYGYGPAALTPLNSVGTRNDCEFG